MPVHHPEARGILGEPALRAKLLSVIAPDLWVSMLQPGTDSHNGLDD